MADNEGDDDVPQLSAETLAALQDFYHEQAEREKKMADIQKGVVPPEMPEEDWELSQFWYSEETAEKLAKEALQAAGDSGKIACVSCPTLYQKLREMRPQTCTCLVFEYDTKFQMYGSDFVFYDYKNPLNLPADLEKQFDLVVADPPFLSEECLKKTAETVKFLGKEKIILCTGAIMAELARKLLGLEECSFKPKHQRNLSNEFRCYSNYKTFHLDK